MISNPAGSSPTVPSGPALQDAQAQQVELRLAVNTVVRDSLPGVAAGLGIVYTLFTLSHLLLLPKNIATSMAVVALLTSLLFWGLYLLLKRGQLPARFAHPAGFGMACVVIANSLLTLLLTREPMQTTNLVLLVVGAGFLFLSPSWLTLTIVVALGGWGVVVWQLPPSESWQHLGFALLSGSLLSAIVHSARLRTAERLERLRIKDAWRQAELERALQRAEETQRSLATSMAVGQSITSILDLDVLLSQVADLIQERFNCYFVAIMLLDESSENLIFQAGSGEAGRRLVRQGLRLNLVDQGLVAWVAANRQPACVEDVAQDNRYLAVEDVPLTRSELTLPLLMGDTLLGVLDMESTQVGAFHPSDVPFLQLLADQVATAIQNARLYQQITRFNQDLESRVKERTEALQAAYDNLERLDQTKTDFISIASHELRTPITVMHGYVQMLQTDPAIQEDAYRSNLVNGIETGASRLNEVIESLLDVAKIDNRELILYPAPVAVESILHMASSSLLKSARERHITFTLEPMSDVPAIEADPDALRKVFAHLIINAIKYTPDGGTITISGRALEADQADLPDGGIEIIVCDSGVGIAPEVNELIFQKFFQTGQLSLHSSGKTKFKGGGPGLGLAIARGIIQAHGGRLWAESPGHDEVQCPGSKFHVILPLRQKNDLEIT